MRNHFKMLSTVSVLALAFVGCSTWTRTEMSSRRGYFFQTDLQAGSGSCVFLGRCSFELYYFDGPPDYNQFRNKRVLYIPGGPGDVVERENPSLNGLNTRSKYVYFDVRGTGYSLIPESNVYDRFLRAKNVVEDIEALRKKYFNECSTGESPTDTGCEQGPKPWDAIYAHSWGTVVAQMYAKKYPQNLKALILSAPVARAVTIGDTGAARRQMIVDNLVDVYRKHRKSPCTWPAIDPSSQDLQWTENFCFLTETELTDIGNRLASLLSLIEHDYGSTDFVRSFWDKLIKEDYFKTTYPYPENFFRALKWLEWYGAGEDTGFRFSQDSRTKKIDAAFFLGYYLKHDAPTPLVNDMGEREPFVCDTDKPFLQLISSDILVRRKFCTRIISAEKALDREAMSDTSLRASSVFGVFDGVARWIFRLMNEAGRTDSENCFTVGSLRDIASGDLLPDKKTVRELAKKIGTSGLTSDERICPWDPARYKHEIPTLIITGGSDPVTAGGQPEYFYSNGLTDQKRAFVKFLGAGHQMSPQVKLQSNVCCFCAEHFYCDGNILSNFGTHFQAIVETFLNNINDVNGFLADTSLSTHLGELDGVLGP
jgi:pimeloyl-ACP methyl ester carboxylesterase